MTRLLLFQKVESNGGLIFKVDLECQKRCYEHFLIYIYGIQCDFMQRSPKNGSLNRDLTNSGMVYFRCYLVNPHVQTVQNTYGKEG